MGIIAKLADCTKDMLIRLCIAFSSVAYPSEKKMQEPVIDE